jgi:hypothetical protein
MYTRRMDMRKETLLITRVQDLIGKKRYERNDEWYDQECQEIGTLI